MTPDDEILQAARHVAIARLHAAYADVVNRRAWPELEGLFLPDARIRIDTVTGKPFELSGPAELGEFIGRATERFAFFEFVVLNDHIELPTAAAPDRARARLFMCEVRRAVETLEWSLAYGVYHDHLRHTADGWRFSRRDYQSLTRTGGDVFPFPDLWGAGRARHGGEPT
jgi:hypothetical protein